MTDPSNAIGREIELADPLDPARAHALHAALDLPGPPPAEGDPLPHFWHWIHFWDIHPPGALGRDGHPRTGGFIPDTGLPRRMWAGGALEWVAALPLGAPARRRSVIADVARKEGRSGPLAFVSVTHEISGAGGTAIRERQELVYRPDPSPGDPSPEPRPAPSDETLAETFRSDPTQLFRYSALTFNGHRIHYDLDYCREVEGYPGLVVHGPLLAQRLIGLAARSLPRLSRFSFRAVAPVFHFESYTACAKPAGEGLAMWVRAGDGRLAMTAAAG